VTVLKAALDTQWLLFPLSSAFHLPGSLVTKKKKKKSKNQNTLVGGGHVETGEEEGGKKTSGQTEFRGQTARENSHFFFSRVK
jgi:hypothetical protein